MDIRAKRNALFHRLTPKPLHRLYREHGREIANAISYSREVLAPYLFFTAAFGIKGHIPGAARLLKTISDGYDGYVAGMDKDFQSAEPSVKSIGEFRIQLAHILRDRHQTLQEKTTSFWTLLGDTDGAIFDQETDKTAQLSDQAGNLLHGDVPEYYFAGTLIRNVTYGRFRTMYRELGVSGSGAANELGQAKTVAFDSLQTLESFGVLGNMHSVRRALTVGGAALNLVSAFVGVTELEKTYLAQTGWDTESASRFDLASLAVARLISYPYTNIDIEPAHLPRFSSGDNLSEHS